MHTRAAILSTGDELVLGQLLDTNARWMAERLTERGIRVTECRIVGDDLSDLTTAMTSLAATHDLLIVSGGLGPTDGDLTRAAIAKVTGDTIVFDQVQADRLTAMLAKRGRTVNERQLRQAHRPSRAVCLDNDFGTAPGLAARIEQDGHGCDVLCLPGPPNELHPMWERSVQPRLRAERLVRMRLLYVVGVPEADLSARLGDLTVRDRVPLVGMTASSGIITIRMRYEGAAGADAGVSAAEADQLLDRDEGVIRERLGAHVVGRRASTDESSDRVLAAGVLEAARGAGLSVAVAESCTGGGLGELLTAIAGSSDVFAGGVIAYSNDVKQSLLGVPREMLVEHGAVSGQVAGAMAAGCARVTGTGLAVSITGVAGPGGGSEAKPVGTVWIGLKAPGGAEARRFHFTGTRDDIRQRAVISALAMLRFAAIGQVCPVLNWQKV